MTKGPVSAATRLTGIAPQFLVDVNRRRDTAVSRLRN